MDLTNVILQHEEIHFATVDTMQHKIYVSEIENSGVYLVTVRKISIVEFIKDKEVFIAMTKDLEAAREKALEAKNRIAAGEQLEKL